MTSSLYNERTSKDFSKSWHWQLPKENFLFQTDLFRQQLTSETAQKQFDEGVKEALKKFDEAQEKIGKPAGQVGEENFSFGQQIEVTIPVDETTVGRFLDFESGQIISHSPAQKKDSKWLIDTGVDIAVDESKYPRLQPVRIENLYPLR